MLTCFVVMGFKTKTDLATGRILDLDATYQCLIKPAVESCGMKCIRADEIVHRGVIDLPMYQQLLEADLVIADVSTANPNALYELGVRHALRPHATIVIAEDKFAAYPFDLNHIVIRSYTHLGTDIGFSEVKRFTTVLTTAIKGWQEAHASDTAKPHDADSPVYTFLKDLKPPKLTVTPEAVNRAIQRGEDENVAADSSAKPESALPDETLAMIIAEGEMAISEGGFQSAKRLFAQAIQRSRPPGSSKPGEISHIGDPYLIHRLVLATYKAKKPDAVTALREALGLLAQLNLPETNDPETLGLAGAIEKRLFEEKQGMEHLELAIDYYRRGYVLKNDHYNGINLAYLLDLRAGTDADPTAAEKIADHVEASRIRRNVLKICSSVIQDLQQKKKELATLPDSDSSRTDVDNRLYWVLATQAEAYFGLGEFQKCHAAGESATEGIQPDEWKQHYTIAINESSQLHRPDWMHDATNAQIEKLGVLINSHVDLFQKLA
jgi:MAP3K TRAFs-binding domain